MRSVMPPGFLGVREMKLVQERICIGSSKIFSWRSQAGNYTKMEDFSLGTGRNKERSSTERSRRLV